MATLAAVTGKCNFHVGDSCCCLPSAEDASVHGYNRVSTRPLLHNNKSGSH